MLSVLKKHLSFFKFGIVGGCSTLLDLTIYMLLVDKMSPSLAKTFSMLCSMTFSYVLNKIWSFKSKKKIRAEIVRYVLVQLCNLIVNVSVNSVVLELLDIKFIAFFTATGVAMLVNFVLQKKYVFN